MCDLKKVLMMAILSTIVLIGACSEKNKVTKTPEGEEISTESPGTVYGFTLFDLAIDTKDMRHALVANYSEKKDKTEALYENKTEDLYLYGNKALEKLDPIFKELDLDPEMDDVDIIKKASEAFELIDYTSLKIKVKFKGRDIKELQMSK
jgi:hypothetical protein